LREDDGVPRRAPGTHFRLLESIHAQRVEWRRDAGDIDAVAGFARGWTAVLVVVVVALAADPTEYRSNQTGCGMMVRTAIQAPRRCTRGRRVSTSWAGCAYGRWVVVVVVVASDTRRADDATALDVGTDGAGFALFRSATGRVEIDRSNLTRPTRSAQGLPVRAVQARWAAGHNSDLLTFGETHRFAKL